MKKHENISLLNEDEIVLLAELEQKRQDKSLSIQENLELAILFIRLAEENEAFRGPGGPSFMVGASGRPSTPSTGSGRRPLSMTGRSRRLRHLERTKPRGSRGSRRVSPAAAAPSSSI